MSVESVMAVLEDLLRDRGSISPWLATVSAYKEELLRMLLVLERVGGMTVHSCPCHESVPGAHYPRCPLGTLLRALGGEGEIQRQTDSGHATAIQDAARIAAFTSLDPAEAITASNAASIMLEEDDRILRRIAYDYPHTFSRLTKSKIFFK